MKKKFALVSPVIIFLLLFTMLGATQKANAQYDFGDAPPSYEINSIGAQLPARNTVSASLFISGLPDAEATASSVAAGADNNGSNGDGADEDGFNIVSTLIKGTAFSTAVNVTNTSGATRTLQGWIDLNNDGVFQSSEYASATIANNSINKPVTLTWSCTQTRTIAEADTALYMRLRISTNTNTNAGPGGTSADRRAIGDGNNATTYLATALIGEIEDYQLSIEPDELFTCTPYLYQIADNVLYKYDVLGNKSVITSLCGDINAIGLDSKAGYMWGYDRATLQVIRIAANGSTTAYNIPNLPGNIYMNVGVTDTSGHLFLYATDAARFYTVDIDASRATYLQLVNPTTGYTLQNTSPYGTSINPPQGISDFAYNPVDGLLYSVTSANANNPFRIVKLDPTTGVASLLPTGQVNSGGIQTNVTFGGCYFDQNGKFYVFGNTNGHLYRVDRSTGIATRISSKSTPSNNNDGGSCVLSAPFTLDLGDAPDSYGTSYNATGAAHIIVPGLMIGSHIDEDTDGQPSTNADADDLNGINDDEDGITMIPSLNTQSTSYSLSVNVTNQTGANALLAGWVDFNRNGTFDPAEMAEVTIPNGGTNALLSWTGLSGIVEGDSYIRVRIQTDSTDLVPSATGGATSGEVEDYKLVILKGTLPISLKHFTVSNNDNEVLLNWTSSYEQNNKGFNIERSDDGITWYSIGFVTSLAQQGNSTVEIGYGFKDEQPLAGNNYYRLKQIDMDGRSNYSVIRKMNFLQDISIAISPNPSINGSIKISGLANGDIITLYNAAGQRIIKKLVISSSVLLNIHTVPEGTYNITILKPNGKIINKKIVKL